MSASSSKGNPASKRMTNQNLKLRRASSWARGQERKKQRVAAQEAAHKRNVAAGVTPWEEAVQARKERRRHDPEVRRRARAYAEDGGGA